MNKNLIKFIFAATVYIVFSVWLCLPHYKDFNQLQYLTVANFPLAALGCFILSQRWINLFSGSFFAGLLYGFGPFTLSLASYHPTSGFLAATIPWLFLPAAFGPSGKWQWLRIPFSILPFVAILLFFELTAHLGLFAIPTQSKLRLSNLTTLIAPLAMANKSLFLVGFYHIPIAALIMGISIFFAVRRIGIIIIFTAGILLSLQNSFFNTSPVIWLTIPILLCSIFIGAGIQGFNLAGFADRKWILVTAVIMAAISVITLLLATKYFSVFASLGDKYAKLLTEEAEMYILGTITVGILFFITKTGLRLHWLRTLILSAAFSADIYIGASFVIDKIL